MTILTEAERVNAKEWYEEGRSFQEIGEQILINRNNIMYFDVVREVTRVLTGVIEFKNRVQCPAFKDILKKRLARGDIEDDGKIRRRERRK